MPGPLVRIETPGTDCMREARSVNPRFRISAPETAVRLMGVVSMVDSRFSAVTTISSSCPASERDCWAIATSASIPPKTDTQPKAAMDLNLLFMKTPLSPAPPAVPPSIYEVDAMLDGRSISRIPGLYWDRLHWVHISQADGHTSAPSTCPPIRQGLARRRP